MSLREKINQEREQALRDHDEFRLATIRWLWSRIRNQEIQKRTQGEEQLTDAEIEQVVARELKQLQEALTDFVTGGRMDLADKTKQEIALLRQYLPPPLTDEAIQLVIAEICREVKAAGPADVGRVMGKVMKELQGRVDGNRVRQMVADTLGDKPISK